MRLPFPLLADEEGKVAGEWHMACDDDAWLRNRSCRGAFIIDRHMTIRYRWIPPNPHMGPDVLSLLREPRLSRSGEPTDAQLPRISHEIHLDVLRDERERMHRRIQDQRLVLPALPGDVHSLRH